MKLNDHARGLNFVTLNEGSNFEPDCFKVSVTLEGATYEGIGRTKKLAKLEASEKALKAMGVWGEEDEKAKALYKKDQEYKINKSVHYHGKGQSGIDYKYEVDPWHGNTTPRGQRGRGKGQRGRGHRGGGHRGRGRGYGQGIDYSRAYDQFVHGGSYGSDDFMGLSSGYVQDSDASAGNPLGTGFDEQSTCSSGTQPPVVGEKMAELAGFGFFSSYTGSSKGLQEIPF